jgi:hypothetical protein
MGDPTSSPTPGPTEETAVLISALPHDPASNRVSSGALIGGMVGFLALMGGGLAASLSLETSKGSVRGSRGLD